jgi:hypothetical protein
MTEPSTLTVEYDELMSRAAELEEPILGQPVENPPSPCGLPMTNTACIQLAFSADAMRLYLGVGERERRRLATSLRNAAKAYEKVDAEATEAVQTGTSAVEAAKLDHAGGEISAAMLGDTQVAAAEPPPYYPVKQAAWEINQPDQGAGLDRFVQAWTAHQRTLLDQTYRFRPFQYWEGMAAVAVETNFDQQRAWMYQMADLCGLLATQARNFASAHRWAVPQHPTVAQIEELDATWRTWYGSMMWPAIKKQLLENYAAYQKKSEEVLGEYEKKAALPLAPLNPPKPPVAVQIDPPPPIPIPDPDNPIPDPDNPFPDPDNPLPDPDNPFPDPDNPLPDPDNPLPDPDNPLPDPDNPLPDPDNPLPDPDNPIPDPEPNPDPTPGPSPDLPDELNPNPPDELDPNNNLPNVPTTPTTPMTPQTPSVPTTPSTPDMTKLTEALNRGSSTNAGAGAGAGVKPAGLGGAGGGGGAPGVPGIPLQPSATPGAAAGPGAPAGAVPDVSNLTRGMPSTGAAGMGGAPMGMPMGAGAQGQGQAGKGKRGEGDESLYTEDRQWTEAVIGNRSRRKDAPDSKDSK